MFEASGVITNGTDCFVVLDNVRRVVRIASHLRPESGDHEWIGAARQGEGYEAVTFSRGTGRFYLMIEAQKHPDGTFKGAIEEYDKRWRFKTRRWVDLPSRSATLDSKVSRRWNFAGSTSCSRCAKGITRRCGRKSRKGGSGRIHVLRQRGGMWKPVVRIKLPRHVKFKDYAGMAVRGDRIAVVSQESSRLWLGRFRSGEWKIKGTGRVYDFPRTKKRQEAVPHRGRRLVAFAHDTRCRLRSPQEALPETKCPNRSVDPRLQGRLTRISPATRTQ